MPPPTSPPPACPACSAVQGEEEFMGCSGLRSPLLAWLVSAGWFPPPSFLSLGLNWLQYYPLTFKSQLLLNKERTELASACAGGGGHWGGRPSHGSSARGHHPHGPAVGVPLRGAERSGSLHWSETWSHRERSRGRDMAHGHPSSLSPRPGIPPFRPNFVSRVAS